jgi:hypothetical protein
MNTEMTFMTNMGKGVYVYIMCVPLLPGSRLNVVPLYIKGICCTSSHKSNSTKNSVLHERKKKYFILSFFLWSSECRHSIKAVELISMSFYCLLCIMGSPWWGARPLYSWARFRKYLYGISKWNSAHCKLRTLVYIPVDGFNIKLYIYLL